MDYFRNIKTANWVAIVLSTVIVLILILNNFLKVLL